MGNSDLSGTLADAAEKCGSTKTAVEIFKERKKAGPKNGDAWKEIVEEVAPAVPTKKAGLLTKLLARQPKPEPKDEEVHSI